MTGVAAKRRVKVPEVAVVDFETFGIQRRPAYPPVPVGVSIIKPGKAPRYYSWGHGSDNNCTKEDARRALLEVWETYPILCHNGKFDYDVATTHVSELISESNAASCFSMPCPTRTRLLEFFKVSTSSGFTVRLPFLSIKAR